MNKGHRYQLIQVEGDVDPDIVFTSDDYDTIVSKAKELRSTCEDGFYCLDIDWQHQLVTIDSFTNAQINPEFQDDSLHTKRSNYIPGCDNGDWL